MSLQSMWLSRIMSQCCASVPEFCMRSLHTQRLSSEACMQLLGVLSVKHLTLFSQCATLCCAVPHYALNYAMLCCAVFLTSRFHCCRNLWPRAQCLASCTTISKSSFQNRPFRLHCMPCARKSPRCAIILTSMVFTAVHALSHGQIRASKRERLLTHCVATPALQLSWQCFTCWDRTCFSQDSDSTVIGSCTLSQNVWMLVNKCVLLMLMPYH